MPRLIHTADIHLGMKFSTLGRAGNQIRTYLKNAFRATVDAVIEKNADGLIIAGDLFDSRMVSRSTYRFVAEEIARLNAKPVIIIPGTHDPAENTLIWSSFKNEIISSNVHLVLDHSESPLTLPELDTTFWVRPNTGSNSSSSPIPELADRTLSTYHVAIAHGTIILPGLSAKDDYPIGIERISKGDFDYVALGHWHSFKQINDLNAYYCGAPEYNRFGLKDAGSVLLAEIDENGAKVERLNTAVTRWFDLELGTEVMMTPGDILKELESYAGEDVILRCRIVGEQISGVNLDTELIEGELEDRFVFLEIDDCTTAENTQRIIADRSPTTITGQFIKAVQERMENATPEMKEILEESLKLGCRLLAGNRPERDL